MQHAGQVVLLGLVVRRANERDAIAAFLATIVVMAIVVRTYTLAFTWYVPLGVIVTLLVGGILSRLNTPAPAVAPL